MKAVEAPHGAGIDPARPFSVIVCTLHRPESLKRAVTSILADSELLAELWVMDQSADEATAELLAKDFRDPRLHYVRLKYRNKSRAANHAAKAARGPYLAFTDDDCEVQRGWLHGIREAFECNPSCDAVLGSILAGHSEPLPFTSTSSLDTEPRVLVHSVSEFYDLGICGGGNMAVRKEAYLCIGGMDEVMGPGAFVPAAADLDFFYRLLVNSRSIVKEPAVHIRHFACRLDNPANRRHMERDYASGAIGFHLKHWRCGDLLARRRLFNYLKERLGFDIRSLGGALLREERRSLTQVYRAAVLLCAHPCWAAFYLVKYSLIPLARIERRYQEPAKLPEGE